MMMRADHRELAALRVRSRRAFGISLGVHLALFVWWAVQRTAAPDVGGITEITWIDEPLPRPVVVAAAAVPAPPAVAPETPAPAPRRATAEATPAPAPDERFPREMRRADSAPEPQSAEVVHDRLNERLASLKRGASTRAPRIAAPMVASTLPSMSLALPAGDAPGPAPVSLERGSSETPAPAELRRAPTSTTAARRAQIQAPVASSATLPASIDTTLQRTVGGASLVGPVADRPLESFATPTYPDWAERDAVEASVSLFFKVMADGRIKEPVLVQKTSGFRDFDRNAIGALLRWRFAPLGGGGSAEQWGEITFHYRLHDTAQH